MTIGLIVQILFVVLALALVLATFWPDMFGPLSLPSSTGTWPKRILWLIVELLVLGVLYWLIAALFLGGPVGSPRAEWALAIGAVAPPTITASNVASDAGSYRGQWLLNAVLVTLSALAVVANVLAMQTAAFLGLPETTWHWVLLGCAIVTALNAAFNKTPPLTKPPTEARLMRVARLRSIDREAADAL